MGYFLWHFHLKDSVIVMRKNMFCMIETFTPTKTVVSSPTKDS